MTAAPLPRPQGLPDQAPPLPTLHSPQTLQSLQHHFQQHVLGQPSEIAAAVAGGGIGVPRRLAIYHHAYRARLRDTLRDTFGHTATYVGDDRFDAAALEYIEHHPSTDASLRGYGESFAAWLVHRFAGAEAEADADADPNAAEIGELARLDWALRRAFDGADAEVLTLAALGALPADAWAHVGFVFQPTFERLRLHFNTLALWQALDDDRAPPPALALAEPGELLVWRRGHEPHFRSLGALESAALDHLQAGLSFAATCERLGERFAGCDVAVEAGTLLRRWVDEALLSATAMRADG